jgi:60 kDa SS-A/Ro ribonucleoprotein
MSNYAKHMVSNQSEKARHDQVQNSTGGYVFGLTPWQRLERFLILGSDSNTYYATARQLTRANAEIVEICWLEDPQQTAGIITEISHEGRAAKNDPAIFALALGTVSTSEEARRAAYNAVSLVCRTGTHIFQFVEMATSLGKGWGSGMKRAVRTWYDSKDMDTLAYQVIKYRQREGLTHNMLLDLCHTQNNDNGPLYQWIVGKKENIGVAPRLVKLFESAQAGMLPVEKFHELPWEAFPTEKLNDPVLWKALLPNMPITAMVRNLGKMTSIGVIAPLSKEVQLVCDKLRNQEQITRSRLHPLQLLTALKTYSQGRGTKGSLSWEPNQLVVRALNDAFYLAFQNVAPTGESYLLALDVSSSMTNHAIMNSAVNCREGAAAMALVTATVEDNVHIVGFARVGDRWNSGTNIVPVPISAGQRLDDAVKAMADVPFGGTDCGAPIKYAIDNKLAVDKFVIYTDNETYGSGAHVFQLLNQYRKQSGRNAKLIVVGMVSNGFTIADPKDAGSLDVVGFDTATPSLISSF